MRGGADVASDENEWPMPLAEDANSLRSGDILPAAATPTDMHAATIPTVSTVIHDQPAADPPADPHVLSIVAEGIIHEKLMQSLDGQAIPELFIDITGSSDQEKFIDEAGWPRLRDRFSDMVRAGSIRSAVLAHPGPNI